MSLLSLGLAAATSRGALLSRAPLPLHLRRAGFMATRMMSTDRTAIPGFETTYSVLKQAEDGAAVVTKGASVTVHATGVVVETGKKFWSTKDPGQQPFSYVAGVGQVTCEPRSFVLRHVTCYVRRLMRCDVCALSAASLPLRSPERAICSSSPFAAHRSVIFSGSWLALR